MKRIIENLLYTETGKDTIIVFLTTGINIFIAGLFFVLTPRILGPSDFGIFATVVATGILAINVANFGICNSRNRIFNFPFACQYTWSLPDSAVFKNCFFFYHFYTFN